MAPLQLEHVSKRYAATLARVGLDDVSLQIDSGEWVGVWGERRSGRSTLLRVAAGVEPPDSGSVRYRGRDLGDAGLNSEIAYCRTTFPARDGRSVLEQLLSAQEALGVTRSAASARAHSLLRHAGAERCVGLRPNQLDAAETIRVAIARALALDPALLVVDEPTIGLDLAIRDSVLALLRSIADDGVSVLMSTGEAPCLSGADRALSISSGRLRGALAPSAATVVPLKREGRSAA
jgi:putative ABC transport system ATP-binding protein